jgi:hypothetical protein
LISTCPWAYAHVPLRLATGGIRAAAVFEIFQVTPIREENGTGYFVVSLTGPNASKKEMVQEQCFLSLVAVLGRGETLKNFQARFPGTMRVEK